jgi:hypothetical protein
VSNNLQNVSTDQFFASICFVVLRLPNFHWQYICPQGKLRPGLVKCE